MHSTVEINILMLVFTFKYQVLSQKSMIMFNLTTREAIIDFKKLACFGPLNTGLKNTYSIGY